MGLMDKFKNLFTEEVEEVKPIKKEVRHVEIPAPKKEIEVTPKKEMDTISDSTAIKKEEKFVFPVYFDDKDFDDLEKPKKKEIKQPIKKIDNAYNGSKREIVEEKKNFRPSLIISPVYGVLDKNYHKDDITSKREPKRNTYYKKTEDVTIDDIRDKAYGTLEDELKNNILGNEELRNEQIENTETAIDLFNELDFNELDNKEKNKKEKIEDTNDSLLFNDTTLDDDTIFLAQQLEEQKRKLDEINEYIHENTVQKSIEKEENIDEQDDDIKSLDDSEKIEGNENIESFEDADDVEEQEETELTEEDLLEEDFGENETDEQEIENSEEETEEEQPNLTESELFDLVDSMYDKEEE